MGEFKKTTSQKKENKLQKTAMKYNPFNLINDTNDRELRKTTACPKEIQRTKKNTTKYNHTQTANHLQTSKR